MLNGQDHNMQLQTVPAVLMLFLIMASFYLFSWCELLKCSTKYSTPGHTKEPTSDRTPQTLQWWNQLGMPNPGTKEEKGWERKMKSTTKKPNRSEILLDAFEEANDDIQLPFTSIDFKFKRPLSISISFLNRYLSMFLFSSFPGPNINSDNTSCSF